MAKKEEKSIKISDMVKDIKRDMAMSSNKNTSKTELSYVPDIMTFIESEDFLNIKTLYPVQKIVLKCFYRGSRGNENLKLTEEEIELCKKIGLDKDDNGNILQKWASGSLFRELVLVWGRRAGKDFISSIIALYETLRLIESPNGDPHAYYRLDPLSLIKILTVAASAEQAEVAFNQIQSKLTRCKYFTDRLHKEGMGMYAITLMTAKDKEENERRKKEGLSEWKGSIVIEVGHSNSETLRGKDIFVCILDEVAFYKKTGGQSGGDQIYAAISPAVNTFVRVVHKVDANGDKVLDALGNPIEERKYEGKIISISSPNGKDGIFYNMYANANRPEAADRLMCRLPTWKVNLQHTEASLRALSIDYSEERFMMEYGGEFSGTAGHTFFPREEVLSCFSPKLKNNPIGKPGIVYFAHLDPANSNHNYALVIVHKEPVKINGKYDFNIVVDQIAYWTPSPGKLIKFSDVDDYMVLLKNRFHFGLITYDHWNSSASIEKLKKHGMPAQRTAFTNRYHQIVYSELHDLVISKRLRCFDHPLLKVEMLNLQKKALGSGYKVYPKTEGECVTDDIVDRLAGACYNCLTMQTSKLPMGLMSNIVLTSSKRQWNSMSGPLGYGTGQQVSDQLNRINSYPNRFR